MDLKFLKWHLIRVPLMRRVVLRAFMLVLALILVSLMHMAREVRVIEPAPSDVAHKCLVNFGLKSNPELNLTDLLKPTSSFSLPIFGPSPLSCKETESLTRVVFKGLMEKNLLQSNAKVLCVGERSAAALLELRHLGFFEVYGVERHPSFSLFKRRFVYELDFGDNQFDFVYSQDLDRLSMPALLVLEIERVLLPGGTGVVLMAAHGLMRSAASVASFLKNSDIVHVCPDRYFTLVIFKKRLEGFASFNYFKLPPHCPSATNGRRFMKHIEPLPAVATWPEPSYLPRFMNISSRRKLVYINIGMGEHAKTSLVKMSGTYCANHHSAFEVFIIDHKISVLSTYVTEPGINFIYHPALKGDTFAPDISSDESMSAPADEDSFDFAHWLKDTVSSDGDFVVLVMKAKPMELEILVELFKTGLICRVDELFLQCRDCMNLLESLRKSGVYAHQWLGD